MAVLVALPVDSEKECGLLLGGGTCCRELAPCLHVPWGYHGIQKQVANNRNNDAGGPLQRDEDDVWVGDESF